VGTERFTRVVPQLGGEGNDNIQLVSQAWGDPVTGKARVNDPGRSDTIKPAGLFSTAPYRPDEDRKPHPGPNGCWGRGGDCKVRPVTGTKYCWFHRHEGD